MSNADCLSRVFEESEAEDLCIASLFELSWYEDLKEKQRENKEVWGANSRG